MKIGSLCTGYGGLDLAAQAVFGGELAWWSDIEPGPIKVMTHHHPNVPNIGDLKVADWSTVEPVDILTAGYPCQPFSNAGKRLGIEDPRHLWPWIAYAVGVLRPRIVILENVAAHLRRGFDVVSADLAGLGYCLSWGIVSAAEAGAPHLRKRLYVVAVAEDAYGSAGGEWWLATPGQAESGWTRPDAGRRSGMAPSDSEGFGWNGGGAEYERKFGRSGPADGRSDVASNADSEGLEVGDWVESYELQAVERSDRQDWVQYTDAIRRWEQTIRCLAPAPTVIGARGGRVLSPFFTEWMMGIPGRVTSIPGLTRNEQIKLAGNGVVPQQAVLAIGELYERLAAHLDTMKAA